MAGVAMADKIRLLIVGSAIALTFVFCATQDYLSFMWMKFWIVIGLAGIVGFCKGWNQGFTAKRSEKEPPRDS